jgi:hypothetical protein
MHIYNPVWFAEETPIELRNANASIELNFITSVERMHQNDKFSKQKLSVL